MMCLMPQVRWKKPLENRVNWAGILACLGVLAVAVPTFVSAQGEAPEPEAMFRQLDTNKDGKLTLGDATGNNRMMLEQILEMAGKKSSGSVTRTEFQQVFERHRAGRGSQPISPERPADRSPRPPSETGELPPVFRQLDDDGNQRISRAELSRLSQIFERFDTNRDGMLDAEEIQAAGRNSAESSTGAESTPRPKPAAERSPGRNRPRETPERSFGSARSGNAKNRLEGVWRGWVVNGRGEQPDEGQMEIELTITGNRITGRELGTQRAPGGIGGGTYVLAGEGTSGNLDADGTSGPQDGRHFLGIYELDGNTLKWCVANRGRQRPQTMATDRGNYLMILRRQAE